MNSVRIVPLLQTLKKVRRWCTVGVACAAVVDVAVGERTVALVKRGHQGFKFASSIVR
jgi:hypothetical protein